MCPWFVPGWSDFGSFTLPVIFRNLCVRSHTTRKDPVKTRDLSCDVYNAPLTISLNWRMISASTRIVRSSLIAASFQFTYFRRVNVDLPSKHPVKQSNDKVRHHYDTPFTALIRLLFTQLVPGLNPAMLLGPQPGINPGINPGTCLRSHRRHSAIFWQFSRTNMQCERGLRQAIKVMLELQCRVCKKH